MEGLHLGGLLLVATVAFSAPLVLGLVPGLRLPAVVLELVAGIAIGPSGLGWVEIDEPLRVFALVGLAFLLFLSGLEVDFTRLRGRYLALPAAGFAVSFALALAVSVGLSAAGQVETPLLVAIILVATSLGVVVPVLKDRGEASSPLGQLVIAAASIADFGAVILLSLFFSRDASGSGAKIVLLGGFALIVAALGVALAGVGRSSRVSSTLLRLQDTTAQIRVRGAFVLLVALVALAQRLGLEVILGAFMAGAILSLVDHDQAMTHPRFRVKLEAVGFGIFIPAFFVISGVQFDLDALVASGSSLALVPLLLLALLVVRGLPALVYRSTIGIRQAGAAGLLQATSLPFIVAASMIGVELGALAPATAAALVAAGLLSVLLFPLCALTVLRGGTHDRPAPTGTGVLLPLETTQGGTT
jgi:Kef-type K+ transport system membrane component KefB